MHPRQLATCILALLVAGLLAGCAADRDAEIDAAAVERALEEEAEEPEVQLRRIGEVRETSTDTGIMAGRLAQGEPSTLEIAFEASANETIVQVIFDEEPLHPVTIRIYHGGSEEPIWTKSDQVEDEFTIFIYGLSGPWRAEVDTTLPEPGFSWTLRVTQNTFVPIE